MHFGRKRSREAKRTNIEITVQEKRVDKKSEDKEKVVKGIKKKIRKDQKSLDLYWFFFV